MIVLTLILAVCPAAAHAAPAIQPIDDQEAMEDEAFTLDFTISGISSDSPDIAVSSSNDGLVPENNIVHTGTGSSHRLVIVPEPDKSGSATITISASDAAGSDSESFRLTVTAANDPPSIDGPDAVEMAEDSGFVFETAGGTSLTVADIDAGNESIRVMLRCADGVFHISSAVSVVTGNDTAEVQIDGTTAHITDDLDGMEFTPAKDFTGVTEIIVKVDDLGHSGVMSSPFATSQITTKRITATVLPANDPPEITVPGPLEIPEDAEAAFGGDAAIIVADVDAENTPVEVTLTMENGLLDLDDDVPAEAIGEGTPEIRLTGSQEDINLSLAKLSCRPGAVYEEVSGGGTVWKREKHWFGTATLHILADDRGNTGEGGPLTDEAEITITVYPVNDVPEINVRREIFTEEDAPVVFSGANKIQVSDVESLETAVNLTVTLDGMGSLAVDNSGFGPSVFLSAEDAKLEITGTCDDINLGLLALQYIPPADWSGAVTISFLLDDRGNDGAQAPETAEALVSIEVEPVNDAPVVENDETVRLTDLDINQQDSANRGNIIVDMIRNAVTDVDHEGLCGIAVIFTETENGRWQYAPASRLTWSDFPDTISEAEALLLKPDNYIRFVPNEDFEGRALLRYRAWDGTKHSAGYQADAREAGGSTPFSETIVSATVTVGDPVILVADAGPDQTVESSETVRLNSSASETPDNAEFTRLWRQLSGTDVTLSNPESVQPTFTAPLVEEGVVQLVFELEMTAGDRTDTDTVVITVTQDMTIYTDAGPDQTVPGGAAVQLDGSQSRIPSGVSAVIRWDRVSGPEISLSDTAVLNPTFIAPEVTETVVIILELSISDGDAQTRIDTVAVTVAPRPPVSASAGPDQTVRETTLAYLDATASQIPDGVSVIFAWEQTDGPAVQLSDQTSPTPSFTAPAAGTGDIILIFRLTVTNTADETDTDSDTVSVTVTRLTPPVANAGPDQTAVRDQTVILDGAGSGDLDGTITHHTWVQLAGESVRIADADQARASFIAPSGGGSGQILRFQLTVRDNDGLENSDSTQVTVTPDPGSGNLETVTEGATVTLSADGPDGFGQVTSVSWTQTGGPAVRLSDPGASLPTFVAPPVSGDDIILRFQADLRNAAGMAATALAAITVQDNGICCFPSDAVTFLSATGKPMAIRVDGGGELVRLVPRSAAAISDLAGRPDDMPYGLIDFTVLTDIGGDAVVTVFLEKAAGEEYSWYKYDAGYGWLDYNGRTRIAADRKSLTITLTDGAQGDDDRAANGKISDPAGLGSAPGSGGEDPPSSGDGDGDGDDGGGCFISSLE